MILEAVVAWSVVLIPILSIAILVLFLQVNDSVFAWLIDKIADVVFKAGVTYVGGSILAAFMYGLSIKIMLIQVVLGLVLITIGIAIKYIQEK